MMPSANYYYATFGDPKPPDKDEAESGSYHPDPRQAPFRIKPGDVMLLYCTGGYGTHPMEVPGIGVVLRVDEKVVEYRYLPLSEPISKDKLEACFSEIDRANFRLKFRTPFWLHQISRGSFTATVENARIVWP